MLNKRVMILLSMLLMLSMTASLMLIPNARAISDTTWITYSYCAVSPNPIGVGQTINVNFWVDSPAPGFGSVWNNLKVIVTDPNGDKTTLGPFTSDLTGGTHTTYVPATVGNYTFQFIFPGQTAVDGSYWEPSNATATDTVQSTPITGFPTTPLPTSYWTRPINALNNNWDTISGNWLGTGEVNFGTTGTYNNTGDYNPYTTAPTTAHILWTRPLTWGGIAGGGEFTSSGTEISNFYATSQYEPKWAPIIMYGILYLEEFPSSSTNPSDWVAINLDTGATLWTDNADNYGGGSPAQTALTANGQVTALTCGQLLDFENPSQYGFLPYLWSEGTPAGMNSVGGTLNLFDAVNGQYLLSIANFSEGYGSNVFPSFTLVNDANGNLLMYYANTTAGSQIIEGKTFTTPVGGQSLECWNATNVINPPGSFALRPNFNGIYNFADGIMWATSLPTTYDGNPIGIPSETPFGYPGLNMPTGSGGGGVTSGVVLMYYVPSDGSIFFNAGWEIDAGFSATTGALLWIKNDTRVPNTLLGTGADYYLGDGYYTYYECGAEKVSCYSLFTGDLAWSHVVPNARPYDSLGGRGIIANGTLYLVTYGGNVYAYDLKSGNLNWEYNTPSGGLESPYLYYSLWVFTDNAVAGGMLFCSEGHEYSPPLYKGCQQLALNMTNGKVVWSIEAFDCDSAPAISDGIMTVPNDYDNQIYAYGMGPTQTTVNAPDIGVTTATSITITGTVMDISAGASQEAVAANFPNGLPCVSDASMSAFMEAVYEQQPMPTNITGVPVTLTETDHNGNTYTIGTTTSDSSGTWAYNWTPPIPGNYTIVATFAGSNSYYGSCAETHIYASAPAPTAAPTASPPTGLATTSTVELGIVAIAIIIIIIGAVIVLLLLRKRP